jgi:hypothetical protein
MFSVPESDHFLSVCINLLISSRFCKLVGLVWLVSGV